MLLFMAFSKLIPVQSLKASTWAFTSTTFFGFPLDQEAENVGAGHIASRIPGTNPAKAFRHWM